MQYAKNEKQAIRMAKNQIKKEMNLSRISEHLIKYKSCNCGCGESPAIEVVTFFNKEQQFTQVGICHYCATGKTEPMTARMIVDDIRSNGGFNNFRNWSKSIIATWVESNYDCSKYTAKKVAQLI